MSEIRNTIVKLSSRVLPSLLLLLLILISLLPYKTPDLLYCFPLFDLIFIFYWGIFNTKLMPLWLIIIISFITDAISGVFIGFSILVNVFAYLFISRHDQEYKQLVFIDLWKIFLTYIIFFSILKWVLLSLIYFYIINFKIVILNIISTLGFYPFFHLLLSKLNKIAIISGK